MAKASDQPLQPNPFCTYRDPQTGLWVVVQPVNFTTHHLPLQEKSHGWDSQNSPSVTSPSTEVSKQTS